MRGWNMFALLVGLLLSGSAFAVDWPENVPSPLSDGDAARYKRLLDEAESGRKPSAEVEKALNSDILVGHVTAQYYLHGGNPGYEQLVGWLKDYADLPEAMALYRMAEDKRLEVTTRKVVTKVKHKGKWVQKVKYVRTTKAVGPLPPKPQWILDKEAREKAAEAAREAEYEGLSDEEAMKRRGLLGTAWIAMRHGDWDKAAATLSSPGARELIGVPRWQSNMVTVADHYMQKRQFSDALPVAKRAAEVSGPTRDDARWIAGMAAYRLGRMDEAAKQWSSLVKEEPVGSQHYARAAWWGARAYEQLGNKDESDRLLKLAAKEDTSFYGQLATAQIGDGSVLEWRTPKIDENDVKALMKVAAAKRGLALAQVGEVALSQQEFRLAENDLPYQATGTLAALGVQLKLPAVALQAGKDLQEQGHEWLGALYPLPVWKPEGKAIVAQPLMLAIMRQESAFHPGIGSPVGAQGLMQLMPQTARAVARMMGRPMPVRADLHDPELNLSLAQAYLKFLDGKMDGNLMLVIASYNGGPGNVDKWFNRGWVSRDDPVLFIESIPFKETKDYVEKVMANLWLYEQRLGGSSGSLNALAHGRWPRPGVAWNVGEWHLASNN